MEALLREKIAEFLSQIPNIDTEDTRRALIANLDHEVQVHINCSTPVASFCQLLISTLVEYGKLENGKESLEFVLKTAKKNVGKDKREYCDTLLQELAEDVGQQTEQSGDVQAQTDHQGQMGYIYDVFLSYQAGFIDPWVQRYFIPLFQWWLEDSLGRPPEVFIAKQGESPSDIYPLRLKIAMAHSRCFVGIWRPSYFQSTWGRREYSMMLQRVGQIDSPPSCCPILPVVVSDGQCFPDFAKSLHKFDCRDFVIRVKAFEKTKRFIEFRDTLRDWVEAVVAKAINQTPPWRENWLDEPDNILDELQPRFHRKLEL